MFLNTYLFNLKISSAKVFMAWNIQKIKQKKYNIQNCCKHFALGFIFPVVATTQSFCIL